MNIGDIEKTYDNLINNIPDSGVSPGEAERLATLFFKATYEINKIKRNIKSDVIILEQASNALYTNAVRSAEGKNVTEKKINANRDLEYLKIMKELGERQNTFEYFKHLLDIMTNGHIFYKNIARE